MLPYKPQFLPISSLDWKKLISLVGQANAALSQYSGLLKGIVNPHILLSPLTTQEATLSSNIEGTQATISEVLESEAGKKYDPAKQADVKEIINYREAMFQSEKLLKQRPFIHLNMIKELHFILLSGVRGENKSRGEFRKDQNWIGPLGCSLDEARYVPPTPMDMLQALDNWEKYLNGEDIDILVQLAFVHAQFEIIHPFKDGNGRIGRILIPLFLFTKQYLTLPVFYLSEYLENNREEYYSRLNAITTNQSWQEWVEFFLKAIIFQAKRNSSKAEAILKLYNEMKIKIPASIHSQYATSVVDALFIRPAFNSKQFMIDAKIESRGTANKLLGRLVSSGIIDISKQFIGRSPAIYKFSELLKIVE